MGRLLTRLATAAPAFTPAQLPTLSLWLDPAYGCYVERTGPVTPCGDNDPVGTWVARTGQVFTAPSNAARPTFKANAGKPYLQLDGADDTLAATLSLTFAEIWAGINLLAFAGNAPSLAGSAAHVRVGPCWYPDTATLYAGDPSDALHPLVNRVDNAVTTAWPGGAHAASQSGAARTYAAVATTLGRVAGVDFLNARLSHVIFLSSQAAAAERARLYGFLAGRLPA